MNGSGSGVARRWRASTVIAATAALAACGGMREMQHTLTALANLQGGLAAEFREPGVSVRVDQTTLTILFVNSPLSDLNADDRAAVGRHAAEFARDHYDGYAGLTTVRVGFTTTRSVGVASVSKTDVPYQYSTRELGPGPDTAAAADSAARAGRK